MLEPIVVPQWRRVKQRVAALRRQGCEPIEAIMTPATWDLLQDQHRATIRGPVGRLSGRELLGLRVKLLPGCEGVIIRYFGGMDFDNGA